MYLVFVRFDANRLGILLTGLLKQPVPVGRVGRFSSASRLPDTTESWLLIHGRVTPHSARKIVR